MVFPSLCLSHCLALLRCDSYKAQTMQLPAYIGKVSTSPQPITAKCFALSVQQQHVPLLPHLLQNILKQKKLPERQTDSEKWTVPLLTVKWCVFPSMNSINESDSEHLITCSRSVLHAQGHFCCGYYSNSKCFELLLWNIIIRKAAQIQQKYHSSDCRLWTGGINILRYAVPFSLSSYVYLKVNIQALFPYSKRKVLLGFLFPRWIQVTTCQFHVVQVHLTIHS